MEMDATSREQIRQRLEGVMEQSSAEEVDWSTVTDQTTIESFGFDSLSVLDLLFDLEQEFSIPIQAEDMLNVKSVGDLVDFLGERAS
jgi:acyl carrier protein